MTSSDAPRWEAHRRDYRNVWIASRSVVHFAVLPASVTVIVDARPGVHRACIKWHVDAPFLVTEYEHM